MFYLIIYYPQYSHLPCFKCLTSSEITFELHANSLSVTTKIQKIWKLEKRKLSQIFGFRLSSFICFDQEGFCFDILTLEFCIFVLLLLFLSFPAKLYDKNIVRIPINIIGEKIYFYYLLFNQSCIKEDLIFNALLLIS